MEVGFPGEHWGGRAARALQSKVWNEHFTSTRSINCKASPDSRRMIAMYPHPFLRRSAVYIERRTIDHSLLRRLCTKMVVGEESKCSQVPQVQRKKPGISLVHRGGELSEFAIGVKFFLPQRKLKYFFYKAEYLLQCHGFSSKSLKA